MNWLRYLLIFVPLAFLAKFVLHNDILIFICSCIALIPLAGLLGEATEELAVHTGPKIGGLLNATLGNAAELIITIVALSQGKVELVKASITGSILGNLLLILGLSMLLGGLRHGIQRFDRSNASVAASMMTLAVIGLIVPTMFEVLHEIEIGKLDVFDTSVIDPSLDKLSMGVAITLIFLYVLSLIYTLRKPDSEPAAHVGVEDHSEEAHAHKAKWDIKTSVGVLAISTLGIVFLSEFLVSAIEPVVEHMGVSELFIGIIIVPLVGNVAEHIVGVQVALKNKMELSMAISLGSSMQIALFVAPVLVFISMLFGPEMTLFFTMFEVAVLAVSVMLATIISHDGESNWLEGAQLLAVYVIVALGFFYTGAA